MLTQKLIRRARARAQALADGVREASADAVVRRVFAIQAQDAVAADLGIRARGQDISPEDIRTAYEAERSIVRGWFMRGTLHTIPGSDARWVLRLLAPRILAATGRRYHQLGLDEGMRERADRLVRRALATHGPLTRHELTERLAAVGYRTRELSVAAAHLGRVWPGGGVIRPTVVADGLAVGTWARRDAGRAVHVDAFAPLSSQVQASVDAEASAITGFLQDVRMAGNMSPRSGSP